MFDRLCRAVFAAVVATPLLFSAVAAQQPVPSEKASPTIMTLTTSSAAKAALEAALVEVENIGGGERFDALLQTVVTADPQFAIGRAYFARWSSKLSAAERKTHLDQAVRDAASATTPELLVATAIRESRDGRNDAARDLFDLVIKMVPGDPHVMFLRQLVSLDNADAVKTAQLATQRFPDFAPSYNLLAYSLNTAGRKAEAITAVERYVALMPKHPNPYDSYGEILSLQGRFAESDVQYRRAIEVDPGFATGRVGLAENAFRAGKPATARAYLETALTNAKTPQQKITAHRQLAITYVYEDNIKQAQQHWLTAITLADGASLKASARTDHRTLAFVAAGQRKSAEALKHYAAAAPATADPYAPINDALFNHLLGRSAEVATARTAMVDNMVGLQGEFPRDAVHLTEVAYAAGANDVATASVHNAEIKSRELGVFGNALMVGVLGRAGNAAGSKAALASVEAYKELDDVAVIARLVARKK